MSLMTPTLADLFAGEQRKVNTLAACRARGLGNRLYIEGGSMPRINLAPHPCMRDMRQVGWNQLERIGAGEDVAKVLGGKR